MNNGTRKKSIRNTCTTRSTGKKKVKGFRKQREGETRYFLCLSASFSHRKK